MRYAEEPGGSKPVKKAEPREPNPVWEIAKTAAIGVVVIFVLLSFFGGVLAVLWALENGRPALAALAGTPVLIILAFGIGEAAKHK